MKKMLDLITEEVTKAFTACGYDEKYAKVTLSERYWSLDMRLSVWRMEESCLKEMRRQCAARIFICVRQRES